MEIQAKTSRRVPAFVQRSTLKNIGSFGGKVVLQNSLWSMFNSPVPQISVYKIIFKRRGGLSQRTGEEWSPEHFDDSTKHPWQSLNARLLCTLLGYLQASLEHMKYKCCHVCTLYNSVNGTLRDTDGKVDLNDWKNEVELGVAAKSYELRPIIASVVSTKHCNNAFHRCRYFTPSLYCSHTC